MPPASQTLSAQSKQTIAGHSAQAVESAMVASRIHLRSRAAWLGKRNRYAIDTIARIKQDAATGASSLKPKQLAEYIAASAPIHVVDGWTFVGRALHSHACGNSAVASHLAYYASLRGAMGLLAARGIGIFDRQHFVVQAGGQVKFVNGHGTHVAAWLCLEEWAQLPDGAHVLGTVIRPEGESLASWIQALPTPTTWAPLGQDWLLRLGLDLRRFAEDRDVRNRASYRPTSLTPRPQIAAADALEFLVDVVRALEPDAPGSFGHLDIGFLRLSLESAFLAATNKSARRSPTKFDAAVQFALDQIVADPTKKSALHAFLTRRDVPDEARLIAEARLASGAHGSAHLHMICRAALLLRVATGACSQLLAAAGLSMSDAMPWWRAIGEERGLWETVPAEEDLLDLWQDIAAALDDISDWTAARATPTYRDLVDDCAQPVSRASALESLAIVGMVP